MRRIVYKTNNEIEANLIKHSLENSNINVYFEHEDLKGIFNGLSANVSTMNILVEEKDYSKAAKLIDSLNRQKPDTTGDKTSDPSEYKNSIKLLIFGILIIATVVIIVIYYIKTFGYYVPVIP